MPANDSSRFVYLFCKMIAKMFLLEQMLRVWKEDIINKRPDLSKKEGRSPNEQTPGLVAPSLQLKFVTEISAKN